ncbi:6af60980-bd6b-49be-913b-22080c196881 [Thermothielavioides terrestris]|uniref:Uncharacterized protein n=2 Tax=Thermothielavioides terrestris TaxID=2587410 RepID=G2QRX8_THETT|nr:uncharacterized protein THITE_2106876 [Thermothielavioides terrestris NRRL 8126]AEO62565.1 hypothetical protein THITE_2106876 [Thermothielavioides terrestris NRRL 8126]SPQ21939.1 6af60980-bd6b-49be-913b-22080c196881 [Thermothielavioides terrestris]
MRTSTARLAVAVAAVVSAPLAASLFASPDSPCAKYCGNVLGRTSTDEMACDSGSLSQTSTGVVWEQCIRCLLTGTYASGSPSDMQALLYNLRFNMEYCLFNAPVNPCITSRACGPLADAVNYKNLTTSVGAYDYCSLWAEDAVPRCTPCLYELPDGNYTNNYVMILEAACEQKPAPGSTVSISGDPFDTVNGVTIVPPQPTYSTVPAPDYGPVSLGARVGIAFGGLAFILALAGFCIVCNGKRRRRAFLRELERRHGAQGWPHPKTPYVGGAGGSSSGGGPEMFETPVSQRPLRGWENDSPVSAQPDGPYPRYFSPYTSQYNSPVSGPESAGASTAAFNQWPTATQEKLLMQMHAHHEKRQNELAIGIALGGDDASLRSKASNLNLNGYPVESKGKEREEAYELHEVESPSENGNRTGKGESRSYNEKHPQPHYRMPAEPQAPVLHHPGYGRHHGSRPGSSGTGGAVGGMDQ